MLGPGRDPRQVVGQRVPIVRGDAQGEQELVGEQHEHPGEEERAEGVGDDFAQDRAPRGEREARSATQPPERERCRERDQLGEPEPHPRDVARRGEHERHDAEIRDVGEVADKQARRQAREPRGRRHEQRGHDSRPDQQQPEHLPSLA